MTSTPASSLYTKTRGWTTSGFEATLFLYALQKIKTSLYIVLYTSQEEMKSPLTPYFAGDEKVHCTLYFT
jgi:hypothetical protein